jgi:RNA polymerase sigma-70 factor (sigma-E family)
MHEPEGFRSYVVEQQPKLLRAAFLLTGDAHLAQDLVQASLVRVWPRWDRISRMDNVDAYVYRVLVTVYAGWRRRRWNAEVPSDEVPGREAVDSQEHDVDRLVLVAALRRLAVKQRAVVVLRFYLDLSERQTAEALGCTVGTVKSHTSRALTALRRIVPERRTDDTRATNGAS